MKTPLIHLILIVLASSKVSKEGSSFCSFEVGLSTTEDLRFEKSILIQIFPSLVVLAVLLDH